MTATPAQQFMHLLLPIEARAMINDGAALAHVQELGFTITPARVSEVLVQIAGNWARPQLVGNNFGGVSHMIRKNARYRLSSARNHVRSQMDRLNLQHEVELNQHGLDNETFEIWARFEKGLETAYRFKLSKGDQKDLVANLIQLMYLAPMFDELPSVQRMRPALTPLWQEAHNFQTAYTKPAWATS
jgi:hypothetical protein